MISTGADAVRWLADSLGLPLLEASGPRGRGGLSLNDSARRALGPTPPRDLLTALASIARVDFSDPGLDRVISAVARGARFSETLGPDQGCRAVVIPAAESVQVLIAPASLQQTAETQRRAAVADLAAGAAHELANALGAIAGWAELGQSDDGARADEALALIEASARPARSAAKSLLAAVSGRAEASQRGPVQLSTLVEDALKLIRPAAQRSHVSIEAAVEPDLHVAGAAAHVWTIVSNLVHNAIEAQPGGGRVAVTLSGGVDHARLVVADDGPGMTEESRRRAFEPYFTTKQDGTGLGLALVRRAIDALGGSLAVESRAGGGTRFTIELPRTEAVAAVPAAAATRRRSGVRTGPAGGALRILVVDDDASIAGLVKTTLALRGHQVVLASTARDAVAAKGPFDVALVDLTLPDRRGDSVVESLRAAGAARACAILSGAEPPADVSGRGAPDAWLRKPFELDDLVQLVQQLAEPTARRAKLRRV